LGHFHFPGSMRTCSADVVAQTRNFRLATHILAELDAELVGFEPFQDTIQCQEMLFQRRRSREHLDNIEIGLVNATAIGQDPSDTTVERSWLTSAPSVDDGGTSSFVCVTSDRASRNPVEQVLFHAR
jgi:hypothetical protein